MQTAGRWAADCLYAKLFPSITRQPTTHRLNNSIQINIWTRIIQSKCACVIREGGGSSSSRLNSFFDGYDRIWKKCLMWPLHAAWALPVCVGVPHSGARVALWSAPRAAKRTRHLLQLLLWLPQQPPGPVAVAAPALLPQHKIKKKKTLITKEANSKSWMNSRRWYKK